MEYSVQYYDLVLLGMIGSIGTGVSLGLLTPVGLTTSVPLFSLVAVLIIGHGLFVNGPVDEVADLSDEVDELN